MDCVVIDYQGHGISFAWMIIHGRTVPALTLSEPYIIIQRDGAVVGAPAAGGAPRSARAAGAAVGAADGVRQRAAPP